jgi:hypothetical protein
MIIPMDALFHPVISGVKVFLILESNFLTALTKECNLLDFKIFIINNLEFYQTTILKRILS